MNGLDLRNAFRADVRDEITPYLWSDNEVYRYGNAAQQMFCRLELGIKDASSAVTAVAVTAGQAFSNISPKILTIRQATKASDGLPLELINLEHLQQSRMSSSDYGDLSSGMALAQSGPIRAVVLGMSSNQVRWVYIPIANDTVNLVVDRLPLETLAADVDLEIDEMHHEYLLLWMKHLAHMKQDAETYDRGRSDMFGQQFRAYCLQAKADRERREHVPRVVAYGGYP